MSACILHLTLRVTSYPATSASLNATPIVSPLLWDRTRLACEMALPGGRLLLLLAIALLAISIAEHKVSAARGADDEHDENVYQVSKGGQGSLKSSQCSPQCARRCSNTQYKKPCLFFCNKCCNVCLCVPSGLYGNKGECPCYDNWKTKRGGPKCP